MKFDLKKIRTSRFDRIVISVALAILTVFVTFQLTNLYYNNQFKIIYNLDQRQNDQEIIKIINQADKYVYFAIFTFTKDNIADALVRAKQRGVVIWGITDAKQSQEGYEKPIIQKLLDARIAIETQRHLDGIMHIKAVVTDKAYAVGSYNWTENATVANDEILEIGTNRYLHDQYLKIVQKVLVTNK